jgi:maltose alpha-D-glucosyltransferase/alpha-amylase
VERELELGLLEADAAALYHPLIIDAPYGYSAVNVMAQERSQASPLRWMRRAIAARKSSKVFGRGTIEFLGPENRRVLAFLREYEGETALVAVNLARSTEWAELDLSRFAGGCRWTCGATGRSPGSRPTGRTC